MTVVKKIVLVGLGVLLGVGIVVAYTALSARYFPTDLTVKFYLRLHGIRSEVNCVGYKALDCPVNLFCNAEPSQIHALSWIRDLRWLLCRCSEFDLADVVDCQKLNRIDISGGVFRHPELFLKFPDLQFACGDLEEPLTNKALCELAKEWPLTYRLTNDNLTYFLSNRNADGKTLRITPDILGSMLPEELARLEYSGAEYLNCWRPASFLALCSPPIGEPYPRDYSVQVFQQTPFVYSNGYASSVFIFTNALPHAVYMMIDDATEMQQYPLVYSQGVWNKDERTDLNRIRRIVDAGSSVELMVRCPSLCEISKVVVEYRTNTTDTTHCCWCSSAPFVPIGKISQDDPVWRCLLRLRVGPYDFKDKTLADAVGMIFKEVRNALRADGSQFSIVYADDVEIQTLRKKMCDFRIDRTSPYEAFRRIAEMFGVEIRYERGVMRMTSMDRISGKECQVPVIECR